MNKFTSRLWLSALTKNKKKEGMAIAFPWGLADSPIDFQYVFITRMTNCGTVNILRQYCIDGQKLDKNQKRPLHSIQTNAAFFYKKWVRFLN